MGTCMAGQNARISKSDIFGPPTSGGGRGRPKKVALGACGTARARPNIADSLKLQRNSKYLQTL